MNSERQDLRSHSSDPAKTPSGARGYRAARKVLVALVLATAATLRFTLPGVPFTDSDAWGYVGPAVSAGLDGGFPQVNGRNFLYPAFLRVVLAVCGDFAAITATQHILGLVGVYLFWSTWRRLRRCLPSGPWLSALYDATGLCALACYAFSNKLIFHEHSLRPESVFCAAACGMLWLTAQVVTRPVGSRTFTLLAITHAAWLAVLYTIHPSFGFGVVFGLLPLLCSIWRNTRAWLYRLLPLVALPAALLLATAAQSAVYTREDVTGSTFGAMTVFAFNADVVLEAIDADLQHPESTPYPAEFLRECSRLIHWEIDRTAREGRMMSTLSYHPDNLIYRQDSVCPLIHGHFENDADAVRAFCMHYALRGIAGRPDLFLAKTVRNLRIVWGADAALLGNVIVKIDVPAELTTSQTFLVDDPPRFREYPPGAACARDLAATPRTEQAWNVEAAQHLARAGRGSFGILMLATLALTALLFVFDRVRGLSGGGRALLSHAGVASGLFAFGIGNCLTVAMVSSFDINRYAENQLAFSIFAYAAAVGVALHLIASVWQRLGPPGWRRATSTVSAAHA